LDEDYTDNPVSGYYGLTYTIGCSLDPPAPPAGQSFGNIPCFFFPNWTEETAEYSKFFNIPIEKLFKLCRINNINPNESIPAECQ
jgi:hypothetical protein